MVVINDLVVRPSQQLGDILSGEISILGCKSGVIFFFFSVSKISLARSERTMLWES